ncbi:MAG TPA: carboxypeptidase regulatory-like domain-containing protein [Bryobacteraceae bacterium]|nr:carboxypeptidase regulatory-like domain-containing protein [Bryobacteraceae bacterium]
MASLLRRLPLIGFALIMTGVMHAQMSQLEGVVKGEDGQPLQNAQIRIERTDIKGKWDLKTKKKGDFLHAGLPLGTYNVTLVIDGKDVDSIKGVKTRLGEPVRADFDLAKAKQQQAAQQKAMETGSVTQEMARDMTPEQKAALEKQMKERSAAMAKNKELNDAFNAGMAAKEAKDYPAAVDAFSKASALDPKQHVIFGHLAEAYSLLANSKTGPERDEALQKSVDAYQKTIELVPTDAGYRNNVALVLAKMGKFDEMEQQINQAVQIDPAGAGRYYFNLGAVLTNANKVDAACAAFKKATDIDANYADAHYQYGLCLAGKATAKPDGTMVFPEGAVPAFQKYLELRPDGANADAAKGMIAAAGGKIETKYEAPGAKKPAAAKKK